MMRWFLHVLCAHVCAAYACALTVWVVVDGWYRLGNFSPARKWAAGILTAPVWVPVSFLVAPRRALLGGRLPGHVIAIYWAVYLVVLVSTILVSRRMSRTRSASVVRAPDNPPETA